MDYSIHHHPAPRDLLDIMLYAVKRTTTRHCILSSYTFTWNKQHILAFCLSRYATPNVKMSVSLVYRAPNIDCLLVKRCDRYALPNSSSNPIVALLSLSLSIPKICCDFSPLYMCVGVGPGPIRSAPIKIHIVINNRSMPVLRGAHHCLPFYIIHFSSLDNSTQPN